MSLWSSGEIITATKLNGLAFVHKSTVANLEAVDTSFYPTGIAGSVLELEKIYIYDSSSTATADGSSVIEPTTGGGRWLEISSGGSGDAAGVADQAAYLSLELANLQAQVQEFAPVLTDGKDLDYEPKILLGEFEQEGEASIASGAYHSEYINVSQLWIEEGERMSENDHFEITLDRTFDYDGFRVNVYMMGDDWLHMYFQNISGGSLALYPMTHKIKVIKENNDDNT